MARSHDFRSAREVAFAGNAFLSHDPMPAGSASPLPHAAKPAHPSLESILHFSGLSLPLLESDPAVIYILRPDLRILYRNLAWDEFAEANQGNNLNRAAVVGSSVMDAVPEPLSNFYESAFSIVKDTARIWEHSIECSSPQLYRLLHMRVLRLFGGHLLIENSIRMEVPRDLPAPPAVVPSPYQDERGTITMCCHCRRTRRIVSGQVAIWDWVPLFLAHPPSKLNSSICQICRAQFFKP